MKKIILLLLILMVTLFLYPSKVTTLTEVMKPGTISVDENQLYITEGASIFIYSLKDFSLLKKFGKQGQGPQEFALHPRVPVSLDVSTDKIIVNSLGKVSYFSKSGGFLKEIRAMPNFFNFQPLGDQFLGLGQSFEKNALFNTVNLFDANLKKIKEIYRADSGLKGPGKGIRVIQKQFVFQGYKNKILLPGSQENFIDAYDTQMKKLFTIKVKDEKLKVTQDFKDKVIHYLKTSVRTKDIYEFLLKPVTFPDYYPAMQAFFVIDDRIYVMIWKKEHQKNQFYIYDMNGKFLKEQWIPLAYQNELEPYPLTLKNGKLYQLIEDLEEEVWNLHISTIE